MRVPAHPAIRITSILVRRDEGHPVRRMAMRMTHAMRNEHCARLRDALYS
jgi:hypothetical protein